jgi:putative hydrolase of the HAD superfamily
MVYVLFDYGGVLCHPQPAADVGLLAHAAGCPAGAFRDAYWAHRLSYDQGELDGASYWQKVGAGLGRSFSGAEIARLIQLDIASWLHLDAGTVALAGDVAAAGHRLGLLSNAPAEVAEAVARLPFIRAFGHCAFSCYLGLVKPDPAIFRAVLARLGAAPAETVFLDDRAENVASAAALGMRAIRFTGPEQARQALTQHGLGLSRA